MKLVLAMVLLILAISADDVEADVQCGNDKFCRVGFKPFAPTRSTKRNEFQLQREMAQDLAIFASRKIVGIKKSYQEVAMIISMQAELCHDDTVGFLLDKDVSEYVTSCVWTGASQFGQCRAVPPNYNRTYQFIEGKEWLKRLTKVRAALGCGLLSKYRVNPKDDYAVHKPALANITHNPFLKERNFELFICNERCVQGGIGFVASVIILLTLAVSFFKNCVEGLN